MKINDPQLLFAMQSYKLHKHKHTYIELYSIGPETLFFL
jgi:hypothetical protein